MRWRAALLVCGIACAGSAPGPAVDVASLWHEANGAYDRGEWNAAVAGYRTLLAEGEDTAALHFNLGGALLGAGELGAAIAQLRQAAWLAPRDREFREALTRARGRARDDLEPPGSSAVRRTLFFWHDALSRRELSVVLLIANAVFWSLLAWHVVGRPRTATTWLAGIAAVVAVATGGSLLYARFVEPAVAVVNAVELEAHSGASIESPVRFRLHAGSELAVSETADGWTRVELPDRQSGWVSTAQIETVRR